MIPWFCDPTKRGAAAAAFRSPWWHREERCQTSVIQLINKWEIQPFFWFVFFSSLNNLMIFAAGFAAKSQVKFSRFWESPWSKRRCLRDLPPLQPSASWTGTRPYLGADKSNLKAPVTTKAEFDTLICNPVPPSGCFYRTEGGSDPILTKNEGCLESPCPLHNISFWSMCGRKKSILNEDVLKFQGTATIPTPFFFFLGLFSVLQRKNIHVISSGLAGPHKPSLGLGTPWAPAASASQELFKCYKSEWIVQSLCLKTCCGIPL